MKMVEGIYQDPFNSHTCCFHSFSRLEQPLAIVFGWEVTQEFLDGAVRDHGLSNVVVLCFVRSPRTFSLA